MDYYNTKTRWSPCSNYFIDRYMTGRYCLSHPGVCDSGWANTGSDDESATTTTVAPSDSCQQYGSDSECASKTSECATNKQVGLYCRKTCNNCNECSDYEDFCPTLTDLYCYEGVYNNKYKNYGCIKRCANCAGGSGVPKPAPQTGCTQYQSSSFCQSVSGECATNPKVMIACRNTCQNCGICSDLATNCASFRNFC